MILQEWEKTIDSLLTNLDDATLDQLHRHTKESGKYDRGEYVTLGDASFRRALKRQDLKFALREGDGIEVARVLFLSHPKAQKLQENLMTLVVDKAARDRVFLDEVKHEWIKTSMTVSPEQLLSTKEYKKLREAYARNAAYIRFVPHQKVPDEPPCTGTDYKP